MNIKIDGKDVYVLDQCCSVRSCFQFFVDKGTYVQGRGYTSYHKKEKYCCGRRHLHGCPDHIQTLDEIDPETVRCCPEPKFNKIRGSKIPSRQVCLTCNEVARGFVLVLRRKLGKQEGKANCCHERVLLSMTDENIWYCPQCSGYFTKKPVKWELGRTFSEAWDECWSKKCI